MDAGIHLVIATLIFVVGLSAEPWSRLIAQLETRIIQGLPFWRLVLYHKALEPELMVSWELCTIRSRSRALYGLKDLSLLSSPVKGLLMKSRWWYTLCLAPDSVEYGSPTIWVPFEVASERAREVAGCCERLVSGSDSTYRLSVILLIWHFLRHPQMLTAFEYRKLSLIWIERNMRL